MSATIYWYDFETFGTDPRRDRPSQFAGLRTDLELNIIDEPLTLYCRPADDFLPSPVSCLITGITPQQAHDQGLPEAEFITRIIEEFARPNTCVAGYNSIRFDDEMTRQLLYRNFFDPYEREWQQGNTRWDIIDMLRLCAAVRPDGISWPRRADGSISFRLEDLTAANNIDFGQAHDALVDVKATIAMADLVRRNQPKLYDYVFGLREKRKVAAELDLHTHKPVVHVSGMYPAEHGRLALTMPICKHPTNNNGVIVYDLRVDPESWLHLDVATLRRRLFAPSSELQEGEQRIPLKTLHTNRCPIVASAGILEPKVAQRLAIDLDACRQHWQQLMDQTDLVSRLQQVWREEQHAAEQDPDFMIYSGGFFSDADKSLMRTLRGTPATDLGRLDLPFRDRRLPEMLFRYRARNYPKTLNEEEQQRWQDFRRQRLQSTAVRERYQHELDEAWERAEPDQHPVLEATEAYVATLLAGIDD
ncbi:MAG: exodeoxyribonuclease I [Pseudohongiellaceae bacterium]